MMLNRDERLLVSSMGWIERGGLVLRDLSSGQIVHVPGDERAYLRLSPIDGDRFLAASHAPHQDSLHLTVRTFTDPAKVLWSLRVTPRDQFSSGDRRASIGIHRHHLAIFNNGGRWGNHLVIVSADGAGAVLGSLPWFNSDHYDLGYQGPIDVVAIPDSERVLISVARSSTIVVHDSAASCEVGRFDLAGRGGNPMLTLVDGELWTIDYDTFVRVSLPPPRILQRVHLQPAAQGVRQFAGDLFAWKLRRKAVVPRPFSGDVAVIDPDSGRIERTIPLGRQPLSCVVTEGGRIIARDWKSGDWIEGSIHKAARWRLR